mgnify:FL=1
MLARAADVQRHAREQDYQAVGGGGAGGACSMVARTRLRMMDAVLAPAVMAASNCIAVAVAVADVAVAVVGGVDGAAVEGSVAIAAAVAHPPCQLAQKVLGQQRMTEKKELGLSSHSGYRLQSQPLTTKENWQWWWWWWWWWWT